MKLSSLLYLAVIIFVSCNSNHRWYTLASAECGFTVDFPAEPKIDSRTSEFDFGKVELKYYLYDAQNTKDENYLYFAGRMILPDSVISLYSADVFFNKAIENSISTYQGEIISVKNISYKEYPGREVRIDFKKGDSVITLRVYLIHNEEFIIQTMTKPSKDGNISQKRFFDSFKITKY